MAANSTEQRKGKTNGEHGINYTQGANQTTFKCSDISLILWRRAFIVRYFHFQIIGENSNILIKWTDFDEKTKAVTINDDK
jgi:hypothetical protein